MDLISFNTSSIGASHIRVGKECQDYSASAKTDQYCIAITCDGHGGDNYFRSAYGSRLAAETALSCIEEFLSACGSTCLPKPNDALVQLEKSIIAGWNARVWEHYESNPFTNDELESVSESRRKRLAARKSIESTYGTTLIALAWTDAFWFAIQIGDGKAVRINQEGEADCPVPINEKCFLNTTTSICDIDALNNFRHYYSTDFPAAIFCGTDGIDDSFIRDEQLYKLYQTIGNSFAESNSDDAKSELEDYLPRLSSKGSGDDVSIAGIIDLDVAKMVFPSMEKKPTPNTEEEVDSEFDNAEGTPVDDADDLSSDDVHNAKADSSTEEDCGYQEAVGISADDIAPDEIADFILRCSSTDVPGLSDEDACVDSEDVVSANQSQGGSNNGSENIEEVISNLSDSEEDEVDSFSDCAEDAAATEKALQPLSDLPTTCPQCGMEFQGNPNFCPNCGRSLSN